jgi:hypothetical protein
MKACQLCGEPAPDSVSLPEGWAAVCDSCAPLILGPLLELLGRFVALGLAGRLGGGTPPP